jgi:hypothetical protein
MSVRESGPFKAGYAAHGTGKTVKHNPFDATWHPRDWATWKLGFEQAAYDRWNAQSAASARAEIGGYA